MKSKLIQIAALLAVMTGCSKQNEVSIIHPPRHMPYRSYIDSIVLENQQIYGNVLILDSLGEAFELLESWSELSYSDLRSEYTECNYTNSAIESHIVYDSLIYEGMQIYGRDYENDEVPLELLSDLEYEVFENYINLIPPKFIYDEEIGHEIGIIEPIGDFDLFALTNEHGIFIVDTFVYKSYFNSIFLAFPISKYNQVAGLEFDQIAALLQAEPDVFGDLIPDLPLVYYHDYYRGENLYPFYKKMKCSNDYAYLMEVSLQAFASHCCFWGTTTLSSKFKLKNYKLGPLGYYYWLTKLPTTGYFGFCYEAYMDNNPHDVQESLEIHIDRNCRRYSDQYIIARFTDGYFAHPEVGFIGAYFHITNGYVTIDE